MSARFFGEVAPLFGGHIDQALDPTVAQFAVGLRRGDDGGLDFAKI